MSISPAASPDIKWALETIAANAERARRPRDYYEGRHPLAFATAKFREAFGMVLKTVSDNLAPVVVDTVADRLQVDGFLTGDDAGDERAREIWRRNRMAKRAGEVHQDALVDADALVIVWPDPTDAKMPILYPNRISNCAVKYDEEQPGFITRAAKGWVDDRGYSRLTLYYADRIERYETRQKSQGGFTTEAKAYEPIQIEGQPPELVNPYGKVPVFHFANRGGIGEMGRTELAEAMPLFDVLNKTLCDRLVAQEFYAFPQRWAIGLEDGGDLKLKPGGVWWVESEKTQFGQFQSASMEGYVTTEESTRKEIARVSRTPLHYFTLEGNFPSGESMRVADAPLLAKVRDRQIGWGMVWADCMRLALVIAGIADKDVETVWANTEPRSESEELDKAAKKRELGYSERRVLTDLGNTPEQIDTMREERATEDVIPLEAP